MAKCEICDGQMDTCHYGSSKCPTCGQGYSYDESDRIELSDEQVELLRAHYREGLANGKVNTPLDLEHAERGTEVRP